MRKNGGKAGFRITPQQQKQQNLPRRPLEEILIFLTVLLLVVAVATLIVMVYK